MAKQWRVAIESSFGDGTEVVLSTHWRVSETIGVGEAGASDVASRVWTHLSEPFLALLPSTAHVDTAVARELTRYWEPYGEIPELGAHVVDEDGASLSSDTKLPRALCGRISIHTNAATRSGHGWVFPPPPLTSSALAAGGQFINDYVLGLQALADAIASDFSVGTIDTHNYDPIVYSLTRHRRGDDNWYFGVTGATAHPTPTWLRSRLTTP